MSRPDLKSFGLLTLLALAGCQYTAQTPSPEVPQPLPAAYGDTATEPLADGQPERWWTGFNRPDLDTLEAEAFQGNLDLAEAWARLRAAQAQAVIAGADLYPAVDGAGSWSKTYSHAGGTHTTTNQWGLGIGIGYEVDLWGSIRAQAESATALVDVSQADVQATALVLSGDVADTWISLLAQNEGLSLLRSQVQTNRTQLDLILLRFGNGQSSALDVLQQKQLVAQVETIIPQIERTLRLSQHQLALLLGDTADREFALEKNMPALPASPSTGLPAALLLQRPDVRAAYQTLASAEWNVAGARADRLPQVSLSVDATTTADAFADLFDSWSASFLVGLAQPLFDAGKRQAEVERQLALARQSLVQYRAVVLNAYKEVMDALANEHWLAEELAALDRQLKAAEQSFAEAQARYLNGQGYYLDVISALSSLQSLQRSRIELIATQLQARVELHLALGGSIPLENPQPGPILSPEDTLPFVPAIAEALGAGQGES